MRPNQWTTVDRIVFLSAIVLLALASPASANPVQDENARPGTSAWQLANRSRGDIDGYASAESVNRGETLRFYVSTAEPKYTIEIFRLGWYGGSGGRRMTDAVEVDGRQQVVPSPDPVTGLVECNWADPYTFTVPNDWVSGVFFVKLIAKASLRSNHIMFVVRDDARTADLLYQWSATTSQAYNNWGGKSLYSFNSTGTPADIVSNDRPFSDATGPAQFLYSWEYPMVRFLEREGYDVTYSSSADTHASAATLDRHRGFLSVGHDEYWSWEMRNNVEARREAGVSLAFFSGNNCYWQIRFAPSASGAPLRRIVAYKEDATSKDPILFDGDPTNDHLATVQWRQVPVNRPEERLIGVMLSITQVDGDIVVENTSHWVYRGTDLRSGDHLRGLAGYEVDRIFGDSPPGLVRLAHSPVTRADGRSDFSDMTIYRAASGAFVFATGTIQWSWGLDDFNAESRGASRVSAAAQQITRNVLNAFITGRTEPPPRRRTVRR